MVKKGSKQCPVDIDIVDHEGGNLYFFFGGIASGLSIPPFEFFKSSSIVQENKIFVRDINQSWYHSGLPGLSSDIQSTAKYLGDRIDELNPAEVIFIGNSMGAFAAIMFCSLLGFGRVVAFAPQTFISPGLRLWYRDFRWQKQIINTYRLGSVGSRIWDIKAVLHDGVKVSIFVSEADRLDMAHAGRLAGVPGVSVYKFPVGGHELVKSVRDKGLLKEIISGRYTEYFDKTTGRFLNEYQV